MIEVRSIRADPERLKQIVRQRKVDPAKADVDRWLELDETRRQLQAELEQLNVEKKQVASLGRTDPAAARSRGQELRELTRVLEERIDAVNVEWTSIMQWFPNWIDPEMPVGAGEEDNVEECAWVPGAGYLSADKLGRGNTSAPFMPQTPVHAEGAEFKPLHHTELGERLGGIDTVQAGKVSGSRFAYILGDIAVMQLAINRLLTDELLRRSYQPIIPPLLVRERSLFGTSHFPEGRDQVYEIKTDNVEEPLPLFLVGSSEPANFSYFMDRTLDGESLPLRVFASTPCFRSEAGSWGRDVKGIKRVHQFDKIEMNVVCSEEQSASIYAELREINEWLLQQLQLPYRIVDKCTGDAGYLATHRQRDVEVWLSGSGEYMEVMTDTNTTDYQARRLDIRYRAADGRVRLCHTVNDTGCAMGRMLIAILDNYQQADGSVKVPRVLASLMGKDYLLPKRLAADVMHYFRIWSDERGNSHMSEVGIDLHEVADYAEGVPPVSIAEAFDVQQGHFSVLPAGWFGDWHPAPSRQYVVLLTGMLEVTTADGVMRGGPGTVWLVEDVTGKGHQTRVVGDEDALRISITLP